MEYTLKPIDSGGIILSYKCNSRCRHCLYAGSPDWNDWLDVGDAALIFQNLLRTNQHLRGFHIAGGEPFLDFERLLRVQRLATEFRIPIEYVETNAGWCANEDIVRDRFAQLRDVGLECILISCSPFHAEHIPLIRIINAVKIGYDVFGPSGVVLWIPEFYRQLSNINTDRPIPFTEYMQSVGENTAKYMVRSGYSLITGGRLGYEMADLYERRPAKWCIEDHCRLELLESGHAHFDPYRNIIPSFCAGISLGDSHDLPSITEALDIEQLPLVKMLVERGPYAIYDLAVNEYDYKPLPEGYIGKCHICVDVRRHLHGRTNKYKELTPGKYYEQLCRSTD